MTALSSGAVPLEASRNTCLDTERENCFQRVYPEYEKRLYGSVDCSVPQVSGTDTVLRGSDGWTVLSHFQDTSDLKDQSRGQRTMREC